LSVNQWFHGAWTRPDHRQNEMNTGITNKILPRCIEHRLRNWWEFGDQEHPCILASVRRPDASPAPDTDDVTRFWTDVDYIVERKMAEIDAQEYLGVAVPYHYVDQGSSAMAGVLGCRMTFVDKTTVWADPVLNSGEAVADVALDRNSVIYRRIQEITARSAALAHDHHFVAPFALEGMSDLMAALYGIENFLIDLIDKPEVVKRGMTRLKELWLQSFSEIQTMIRGSGNSGGIGWVGIWAPGSTFPLQEDVAYNLSPDMFRSFCLPHLHDQIAAMEYPFFHLDGVGMIPHLDMLLDIPKLKAIQWGPGAGKERLGQWYGLIRRILSAGKSVQVFAQSEEVDSLVQNVGARGLLVILTDTERDHVLSLLERYPQREP